MGLGGVAALSMRFPGDGWVGEVHLSGTLICGTPAVKLGLKRDCLRVSEGKEEKRGRLGTR